MTVAYDESKKGRKIASGGDRSVYMYGPDHVVKISSLSFGGKLHDKLVRDNHVCRKYLADFLVDTVDVTAGSKTHVEVQPYIRGEMLRREHVKNSKVREQLEAIRDAMSRMESDGHPPIDLMGNGGVFVQCLSNILVDEQSNLRIVDATLYEAKSVGLPGLIFEMLFPLAVWRQRYLLENFLKE